ncbi:MAG: hypothetical protein ABEJ24_04645 [Candidatus Magasanikbacteria bacterium]
MSHLQLLGFICSSVLGFFIILSISIIPSTRGVQSASGLQSIVLGLGMALLIFSGILLCAFLTTGNPVKVEHTRGFEVKTCIGKKNAIGNYPDSEEKSKIFVTLPKGCKCKKKKLINYTAKYEKCQWK